VLSSHRGDFRHLRSNPSIVEQPYLYQDLYNLSLDSSTTPSGFIAIAAIHLRFGTLIGADTVGTPAIQRSPDGNLIREVTRSISAFTAILPQNGMTIITSSRLQQTTAFCPDKSTSPFMSSKSYANVKSSSLTLTLFPGSKRKYCIPLKVATLIPQQFGSRVFFSCSFAPSRFWPMYLARTRSD